MNVARRRLLAQHVARPVHDDPAAVVRALGAVQAQDWASGIWAVGLRTRDATASVVEDAIARAAIIRTWPMRGTLHFVSMEDVRWMPELLAPRVIATSAGRYRQLELDDRVFAAAARVAERLLTDAAPQTRATLYAAWNAAGIVTGASRGLHLLGHLAQRGLLCCGPRAGAQPTFTLVEQWAPGARRLPRDEALGTLAFRYFTSHGPATVHDFAWWSGLTITDARAAVDLAAGELGFDDAGDRRVWYGQGAASGRVGTRAWLLPAWDEFTVAYRDRDDMIDPRHARRVNAGGGVLKPVVVVGGRVVGTWRRTTGRRAVAVTHSPFSRAHRAPAAALAAAARRYGDFLGAPDVMVSTS